MNRMRTCWVLMAGVACVCCLRRAWLACTMRTQLIISQLESHCSRLTAPSIVQSATAERISWAGKLCRYFKTLGRFEKRFVNLKVGNSQEVDATHQPDRVLKWSNTWTANLCLDPTINSELSVATPNAACVSTERFINIECWTSNSIFCYPSVDRLGIYSRSSPLIASLKMFVCFISWIVARFWSH